MSRVLEVEGLDVAVRRDGGLHSVLDDVSFAVERGQCLGIVGESGSGKSLTLRAAIGLLPPGVVRTDGIVRFAAADDAALADVDPASLAGRGLAMVFQDSHAALNPTLRVGRFIADVVRRTGVTATEARLRTLELLEAVGIPAPDVRARAFPHQLSGGLRQRVAIALALASDPSVLLCDEPTTALDVTLQAQILGLLTAARRERGLGLVFVSHDVAVVREVADVIAVMYAGQIVECGTAAEVIDTPRHPYTQALVATVPALDRAPGGFTSIPGTPPDVTEYDGGCRFRHRCGHTDLACAGVVPGLRRLDLGAAASACVHDARLGSPARVS